MDKRWPKNSVANDPKKRKAMHRFCDKTKKIKDGRIGLLTLMSWDEGYEAARRRFDR